MVIDFVISTSLPPAPGGIAGWGGGGGVEECGAGMRTPAGGGLRMRRRHVDVMHGGACTLGFGGTHSYVDDQRGRPDAHDGWPKERKLTLYTGPLTPAIPLVFSI